MQQSQSNQKRINKILQKLQPNLNPFIKRLQFIKFTEDFKKDHDSSTILISQNLDSSSIQKTIQTIQTNAITSQKMLQKTYKYYQALIYRFGSLQNLPSIRIQCISDDSPLNTIDKMYLQKRKSYIKKMFHISQEIQNEWQFFVSFSNLRKLYKKGWQVLNPIIAANFKFIEGKQKVGLEFQRKDILLSLRLNIIILIIDIIRLLNSLKTLCFKPIQDNPNSQLRQRIQQDQWQPLKTQEKYNIQFFQDLIEMYLRQNKPGNTILKQKDLKYNQVIYDFWFELSKARKLYYIQNQLSLQQGLKAQMQVYCNFNSRLTQILKISNNTEKSKINFLDIFDSYRKYFHAILKQSKEINQDHILYSYWNLIQRVFMRMDIWAAYQIFIKQFDYVTNQIKLVIPNEFFCRSTLIVQQLLLYFCQIYRQNFLKETMSKQITAFLKIQQTEVLEEFLQNRYQIIHRNLQLLQIQNIMKQNQEKQMKIYNQFLKRLYNQRKRHQFFKDQLSQIQSILQIFRRQCVNNQQNQDYFLKLSQSITNERQKLQINILKLFMKMKKNLDSLKQTQLQQKQLLQCKQQLSKIANNQNLTKEQKEVCLLFLSILDQQSNVIQNKNKNLKMKIISYKNTKIESKIQKIERQYQKLIQSKIIMDHQFYNLASLKKQTIKKFVQISTHFQKGQYFQGWTKLKQNHPFSKEFTKRNQQGYHRIINIAIYIYNCPQFVQRKNQLMKNSSGLKTRNNNIQNLCSIFKNSYKNWSKIRQKVKNLIGSLYDMQLIQDLTKQIQPQESITLGRRTSDTQLKSQKQNPSIKLLDQKIIIQNIYKDNYLKSKKYIVNFGNQKQYQAFLSKVSKLKKLKQLNKSLDIIQDSENKRNVQIHVDQFVQTFQNYPQLVKHLIKQYLDIVKFCQNKLQQKLYPLLRNAHVKIDYNPQIGSSWDEQKIITYIFNPYEGILLNMLFNEQQIKINKLYDYPCFPIIHLAQLLQKQSFIGIYTKKDAEYYAFKNLIQQMKALSMEESDYQQLKRKIYECPYFWTAKEKLYEIVEFKQRYQKMINMEESRRKRNNHNKQMDRTKQGYQKAYGWQQTAQIYFSIQGILQRQAYLQNIQNHNQRPIFSQIYGPNKNFHYDSNNNNNNKQYKKYLWFDSNNLKQKQQIYTFLQIQARTSLRRQKNIQNNQFSQKQVNDAIYKMTYASFQYHMRNLRNFTVHNLSDEIEKYQYSSIKKLGFFEKNYPQFFVFFYRWKPYLGKDFRKIKQQQIKYLSQVVFVNQKPFNEDVIQSLTKQEMLKKYNIDNTKNPNTLRNLFGFQWKNMQSLFTQEFVVGKHKCKPCQILGIAMNKKSFWEFLQDIRQNDNQKDKDNIEKKQNKKNKQPFNVLYYQHDYYKCNVFQNLISAFKNTLKRQQIQPQEYEQLTKQQMQQLPQLKQKIQYEKYSDQEICQLMYDTDYVYKGFIFQLQSRFPFLFYDLRRYRYRWDIKAKQFPE